MNGDRMKIINPATGQAEYLVDEKNQVQDLVPPGKRETDRKRSKQQQGEQNGEN